VEIDTKAQLQILEELRNAYPKHLIVDFQQRQEYGTPEFQANLVYLREHGYIRFLPLSKTDEQGTRSPIMWARITAEGLGFLVEYKKQNKPWYKFLRFVNNNWVVTLVAGAILVFLAAWFG
jgi:hypothetical protein